MSRGRTPSVVLDTNVVVSAMLWRGRPGELFGLAAEGLVQLASSRVLIDELRGTLAKRRLARAVAASGSSIHDLVGSYGRMVRIVRPGAIAALSRDPDDDHVIACAQAARAGWIVSGDVDLLELSTVDGIRIVSVAGFLGEFLWPANSP